MEDFFGHNPWVLLLALIWSVIWKGIALWESARRSHKGWFVAVLLISTLGLLEIIYLYGFARRSSEKEFFRTDI